MSSPKRPGRAIGRFAKRLAERAARKLVVDKQKLAGLSRGGSEDNPIEVSSSVVIDLRAAAMPCPLCEGQLRIEEHRALSAASRAVDVRCARCDIPRTIYFRVAPVGPN